MNIKIRLKVLTVEDSLQLAAGNLQLPLFPKPAVADLFLTVIARNGDAPADFFFDIEALMARPIG